ncbi:hypothetical protein F4811DRAFT_433827 [Daldinia bambusicola]|nr:hypothetical protein F4811DRAFT_433827 [Daldinia bambusicola]
MRAFTSGLRRSGCRLINNFGITSTLSLNRSPFAQARNTPKTPPPSQRKYTSWVPWEQPNPSLYSAPHVPLSTKSGQGASSSGDAAAQDPYPRNVVVGKNAAGPRTTAIVAVAGAGSQEISTSRTIAAASSSSSPIPAGASPVPQIYQKRAIQTHAENPEPPLLPTTLLRIPGETATWPCDKPEPPHQPRVRKCSDSNSGSDSDSVVQESGSNGSSESREGDEAAQSQDSNVQERQDAGEKSG